MKSLYAGIEAKIPEAHRVTKAQINVLKDGLYSVDKTLLILNQKESQLFQRIVDSIKFDDPYYSRVLAREMVFLRETQKKLKILRLTLTQTIIKTLE